MIKGAVSLDFTAIDFETATSYPGSICSVGIAVVKNGTVSETKEILVRPEPFEFNEYNTSIHGITPEMVYDKPKFCDIWENEVKPLVQNGVVAAHNASFDIGAMRAALDLCGVEYPELEYICTVKLSQKAYPELPGHKLNFMAEALSIDFNHHRAGDDAYVCAEILLKIMKDFDLKNLEDIEKKFEIGIGKLYPGCYIPCTKSKNSKARKLHKVQSK